MTSNQRSGFDPPPQTFTTEEAEMLKEFAAASLSGRLWMCRFYRILAGVGKVAGVIGMIAGAFAAVLAALHSGGR